jgi:hypothetical protein
MCLHGSVLRSRRLLLAPLLAALAWLGPTPVAGASASPVLRPVGPQLLHAVAASGITALTPADIHTAYGLPDRGASGQTVAVVSPYNDPSVQADLDAYDKRFGLPACTTANGCFRRLNAKGEPGPYPGPDISGGQWVTESALGTEIVHAVCQSCKVLLVEADTDTKSDVSAAIAAAAHAGATVIVTAFTSTEDTIDSDWALDYLQPRAAIVAAAGDAQTGVTYGYGEPQFPSNQSTVIAVGGTTLRLRSGGGYAGESAWVGAVSGCSLFQPAASWQTAIAKAAGCGTERAVADVSAVADPGALVHITGSGQPGGPWFTAEGTSLAAPIIAGTIGLAGSLGDRESQTLYAHAKTEPSAFHDIRTGSNAPTCSSAICRAGRGWDGPTGLGTPYGLAAFLASGGALNRSHPRISTVTTHGQLSIGKRFTTRLPLANSNPFALTGNLTLRATVKRGGRSQAVTLASAKLSLGPLATDPVKLTIAPGSRSLLRSSVRLGATVYIVVAGPAGRAVTVKQRLTLLAP